MLVCILFIVDICDYVKNVISHYSVIHHCDFLFSFTDVTLEGHGVS